MTNSSDGSSKKNGKPHQSVYPSKDSMTKKSESSATSRLVPPNDPMSLLTSPARGLDSAITGSMLDLGSGVDDGPVNLSQEKTQFKFREYISEKLVEQSTSCINLIAEPTPTPMLGMPSNYAEQLKEGPEVTKLRHGLEEILLSVRRLREGIMSSRRIDDLTIDVYETSVILSILCGDKAQLASSISRLIRDVYPIVSENSLKSARNSFLSQDLCALFAGEICPSALWGQNSGESNFFTDRLALFRGVWLLESICSNRPGYAQEYLSRRASLKKHGQSPSGDLSINFCHKVFLAIERKEPMSLHNTMTAQLDGFTSCSSTEHGGSTILFWLRTLAQQVLPMARAQSGRIIRHAFLRMSVWRELQYILQDEIQAVHVSNKCPGNSESVRYFESKLLLDSKLQQWTHTHLRSFSPLTTQETRKHNSLIIVKILAVQFDKQSWSDALMLLRNRLVEHEGSYAVTLRP